MSESKIGPREQQLRAMREHNFEVAAAASKQKIKTLREKVAAIPVKKRKKEKRR